MAKLETTYWIDVKIPTRKLIRATKAINKATKAIEKATAAIEKATAAMVAFAEAMKKMEIEGENK